ncbi:hypothetical protein MA16_Dca022775 [Dendrobium catenatum]|uniref:Uncharacterized protein n=1 Tax=Dendrobium catenatum TaxID=906689 RepID=A0A2I0WL02_9ASPA|nr:hypothetical protein MA16_Dca022775 [Dendrobium catenatum]
MNPLDKVSVKRVIQAWHKAAGIMLWSLNTTHVELMRHVQVQEEQVDPASSWLRGKYENMISTFKSRLAQIEEVIHGMEVQVDWMEVRMDGIEEEDSTIHGALKDMISHLEDTMRDKMAKMHEGFLSLVQETKALETLMDDEVVEVAANGINDMNISSNGMNKEEKGLDRANSDMMKNTGIKDWMRSSDGVKKIKKWRGRVNKVWMAREMIKDGTIEVFPTYVVHDKKMERKGSSFIKNKKGRGSGVPLAKEVESLGPFIDFHWFKFDRGRKTEDAKSVKVIENGVMFGSIGGNTSPLVN